MKSQFRSRRKVSGGKYSKRRKKKLRELSGVPSLTSIGNKRVKKKRVKGRNFKYSLLSSQFVVINQKNKSVSLKINSVSTNPSNIYFTRRNIITKGTIVTTDKGDVKITTRPGQNGTLFGVFIS